MRIRHSVTRCFGLLVLPTVTVAVVSYFGTYAIWGSRGVLALGNTQVELGIAQEQLAQLEQNRARLRHHIALMEQNGGDPDLIEELARGQLMDAEPNQVAIPRSQR